MREKQLLYIFILLTIFSGLYQAFASEIVINESKISTEKLLNMYKEDVLKREKTTKFIFKQPSLNFYTISNYFSQYLWKDGDMNVELKSYSISGNVGARNLCTDVTISSEFIEPDQQYNFVQNFISKKLPEILKGAQNDIEKVWAINEWIKSWVDYDYSYKRSTSYEAIVDRLSVCNGYAMLFYRIAKAAGLEVKFVSGTAKNSAYSGRHAWNAVKIDGKWYFVDVTWNDTEYSGNQYLLASYNDLSKSHRAETPLPQPLATEHYFDTLYKLVVNNKDVKAYENIEKLYGYKLGFNKACLYNAVLEALQKGSSTLIYDYNAFKKDFDDILNELFESYNSSYTRVEFKKTLGIDLWIFQINLSGTAKSNNPKPKNIFSY